MKKLLTTVLLWALSCSIYAGENINQILEKFQFSQQEIVELFFHNSDLPELPIAYYKAETSEENALELKLYVENTNDILLLSKVNGSIEVRKAPFTYELENKYFDGEVNGNLYESFLLSLGDENLARFLSDAYEKDLPSMKGLKVKASFEATVSMIVENEELVKPVKILSSKLIVGKALVEKAMKLDNATNEEKLVTLIPDDTEREFVSPIGSNVISSGFNLARKHPIKRRIQPHNGVDFRAKSGTPVFPAREGKVIAIGRAKAKGKFVLIEHEDGFKTTYDHLKKFQKGLKVGQMVTTADQIGEVGRTGYATGAHLHFCIIKNGMYVNPIYYLKDFQLDEETDTASLEE